MENLNYFNKPSKNKDLENSEYQKKDNLSLSDSVFKECSFNNFYTDISTKIEEAINENFTIDKKDLYDLIEDRLKFYYGENVVEKIQDNQQGNIFTELNKDESINQKYFPIHSKEWFCSVCVTYYQRKQILPNTKITSNGEGHFVIHYSNSLSDNTLQYIEKLLEDNFDYVCDVFHLSSDARKNLITDIYICDDKEINEIHLIDSGKKDKKVPGGWYSYRYCVALSPDNATSNLIPLHEFVHSVSYLDGIVRQGWITEGIAQFFSGDRTSLSDLQKALEQFPLNQVNLDKLFSDDRKVFYQIGNDENNKVDKKVAYYYAYTIVNYIVTEFGVDKISEIFNDPEKKPFKILKVREKDFQKGWIEFLDRYITYLETEQKIENLSLKIENAINAFILDNKKELLDNENKDFYAFIKDRLIFYCGEDVLQTIKGKQQENVFSEFNEDGTIGHKGILTLSKKWFFSESIKLYLREQILPETYKTKHGHFVIHHNGLSEKARDGIEKKLEGKFNTICKLFRSLMDKSSELVTDVYICNKKELDKFHKIDFDYIGPKWIGGWYGIRYCVAPNPDNASSPVEFNKTLLAPLHEFIHSITYSNGILRQGWISEGTALYFSGEKTKISDLKDALERFPLNQKNLNKLFSDNRPDFFSIEGQLGYKYAYTIVDYIVKKFGKEKIPEIFEYPKKSPFKILGVTKKDFQKGWKNFLYQEYLKDN